MLFYLFTSYVILGAFAFGLPLAALWFMRPMGCARSRGYAARCRLVWAMSLLRRTEERAE